MSLKVCARPSYKSSDQDKSHLSELATGDSKESGKLFGTVSQSGWWLAPAAFLGVLLWIGIFLFAMSWIGR